MKECEEWTVGLDELQAMQQCPKCVLIKYPGRSLNWEQVVSDLRTGGVDS